MRKTIKKKKGINATKKNYFWDIGIATGFLLVFSQEITGETLHEWLALALFAGIITHIIFHWKWIVNISKRFFSPKLNRKTRMNYIVNGGLAFAFIMMGMTGLMISEAIMPQFGLGHGGDLWEELHEAAGSFALIMVGTHALLHWKWILTNTKKYLFGGRRLTPKMTSIRR